MQIILHTTVQKIRTPTLVHTIHIFLIVICGREQGFILYITNQKIQSINTIYNTNLHFSTANLTVFQRKVYFLGIKLFNHLAVSIKSLSHETELFKPALKTFLLLH
jgi:hypothetical protein